VKIYFNFCRIEHPAPYKGMANPYGIIAIEKEIIDDVNILFYAHHMGFFSYQRPSPGGFFSFSFFKLDVLPHGLITRLEILTTT